LAAPVELGIHVDGGGTRAAEILVREVEEFLIVGVGVNGGHVPLLMRRFPGEPWQLGETVGGAGGVEIDVCVARIGKSCR